MIGYQRAFRNAGAQNHISSARPEGIKIVMRRATARTWKNLARERLRDVRPKIPLGKRFWPLLQNETSAIAELFKASEPRRLITLLKGRRDDARSACLTRPIG